MITTLALADAWAARKDSQQDNESLFNISPLLFTRAGTSASGWWLGLRMDAGVQQLDALVRPTGLPVGTGARHAGPPGMADEYLLTIWLPRWAPPPTVYPCVRVFPRAYKLYW
eukprot:GHVU01020919.1.p2 GENE.GHVU01020919.1~~GHVU01020919.1.p2  ORF type:complete len:113 (-),score=4.44 GHVU01020919.1:358-696(-)